MSGFEHYQQEMAQIDREILHYAMVCQIDINDHFALKYCLEHAHASWPEDKARQSLRGLLLLRLTLEAEMLAMGLPFPPLFSSVEQ